MMVTKSLRLCCLLIVFNSLFASGMEYEEEVKKVLKLPYDQEHDFGSADAKLSKMGNRIGIGGFGAISEIVKHPPSENEEHYTVDLCSSDLSVFQLTFSKPKFCRSACDKILQSVLERDYSHMEGIINSNKAEFEAGRYTLTTSLSNFIRISRLDIRKAVMVQVVYRPLQQPLLSPVNREAVKAQMALLVEKTVALFDSEFQTTDEEESVYKKLKEAYSQAEKRVKAKDVQEGAAKFSLFLSNITLRTQEKKGSGGKLEKAIARKPYLLACAGGKALPVVKVASPEKVTGKIEVGLESDGISDIKFQATSQGKRASVDVALSSDGQYEVSFCLPGKYTLGVFCMDKTGRVVQFGELDIDVEPDRGDKTER